MTAANDPTGTPVSSSGEPQPAVESISIQAVPPTPTAPAVVQQASEPQAPLTPRAALPLACAGSTCSPWDWCWRSRSCSRRFPPTTATSGNTSRQAGSSPTASTTLARIPSRTVSKTAAAWTNSHWLYDWAVYHVAAAPDGGLPALGGAVLILVKGLLVVLLAGLLIRLRRQGSSAWIPLCITALALFVMTPRLLLQPTLLSFLMLGVTLYLLHSPKKADAQAQTQTSRRRWLLPLVCLLWANLDDWFLLGPLTIGLYLLGETCQALLPSGPEDEQPAERGSLPALGLIFVLSAVACLLNPTFLAHPRLDAAAFVPPDLLAMLSDSPLQQQSIFRVLFVDPLHPEYYQYYFGGSLLTTPVALSYFVLLGLGLLSFALNFKDWCWWRAFVWLPFALLSLMAARAIPFFAVVGAVVATLNFQDFAARVFERTPRPDARGAGWLFAGRVLTVLAGVALLVAAWPGWLYPHYNDPFRSRHVGWAVVPNVSLHKAALRLHDLYTRGVLEADKGDQPGTRGFNTTPDIANYCAWFCPEEKCFFDFRLSLYPESVASAYVQVRQALLPAVVDASDEASDLALSDDWKEVLRNAHVNHVVLHDSSIATLYPALHKLWFQDRRHWELLYVDGQTVILGWKDATAGEGQPFRDHYFDLNALAFGPNAQRIPPDMPAPPERAESWVEQTIQFLRDYWQGPAPRPAEIDQATMYLAYFGNIAETTRPYCRATALLAGLTGPAMTPGASATMPLEVLNFELLGGNLAGYLETALAPQKDYGPPAAALLAVRTARAAVAANPATPRPT